MKTLGKTLVLAAAMSAANLCVAEIVSFKDAAKIRSWDAWSDHKGPQTWKEKRCVTREKLLKMDPGLELVGQLETRQAKDISSSRWSVGCETLDRDYADWNRYKRFLPDLGCTRGRLFSGWAKTEQEKGVYDFTWLDPQVREMAAMGIKPWICISYGNPVWGSDFRLGMRVKQVTGNPESFAAWLRYVKALVERYKDVVDEWEIWNEPFGQAEEYAEMVYRTAKAVHEVQPKAKCYVTAITWTRDMSTNDYYVVLERLKKENALDLVDLWIYHPYCIRPEECYPIQAEPLRRLVKSYRSEYDIFQGEVGCPSQLEFAHALSNIEWTEYSQAKWDLRRAIGDAARNIPSSCFTFIDLQYTFMLQSFGLIRSNTLKEPVYRRPSFFAMQNVYSYFDDDVHALGVETKKVNGRELTIARFERYSRPVYVVWYSDARPGDSLEYERADLSFLDIPRDASWVDLMNGRIYMLPDKKSVPVWDSPVLIVTTQQLPRRTVWSEMAPAEIVEAFYRPAYRRGLSAGRKTKMPVADEPWAKMATTNFLPCIDRFGQFKYRDWPGKVRDEAELKADIAKEEADLAAHPGPADWNEYGGWTKGPQLKATGRFRAEKVDGKWWLVDPAGRLFWSWGAVRVTPSSAVTPLNGNPRTPRTGGNMPDRDCLFEGLPAEGTPLAQFYRTYDSLLRPFYLARNETRTFDFSSANIYRKYGEGWFEKYSDMCHRRLRSWGANTIANSSDLRICLQDRTPYAERVECRSRPISASWGSWGKFRDPFDPSFTEGVRKALDEHGREAHDKWCIGFFIDNEIQWGAKETDLAQWTLWSEDGQPAKVEFLKRLAAKGIDPKAQKVPDEELKAFTRVIVDEYFRRTRETVKAFDTGLLYLGCRFAGRAPSWAIDACAKYCDVVSYNIYTDELGSWRLPDGLDAPVMIGEFHFGAWDRGLFGSGLINKGSQEGRASALKKYVESALGNPQIVGVHWHQFSDQPVTGRFDGEFFQVGWTDVCDRPYPETVKAIREVGGEMYSRRARQVEIRAMMLKLGSNTHAEPLHPSEKPKNQWDYEHTVVDRLRLDEDVWREVTDAMAAKGYNMVVIGLAEGVVYPSHPELAVKGSWSVEKLKVELKRLRSMGLEPIPKMNFAASHDAWLGEYHRMVSTETYYKVCADLIRDVVEMFDRPRFIHLGYDEEMPIAQEKSAYMVVRQGELWWHDFEFFRKEVEKHGVRAWIWSDYFWHHPKEFLKRMPKSVLQSNWYYRTDFGEKICDRAQMEKKIMSAPWPEYVAGPSTYVEFEKAGYDQLPCGSVWANDGCMAATVRFCRERISGDRLKGFLMAPWLATIKSNREQLLFAVETGARAFAADPQPPEMVWVETGVCTMPIVASKDKKTRQAAKYLADCVEEMTGVRPEIKDEWTGRAIRIETTAAADDESFRTVTKYGSVFMTGAAYHAAYDFAERVLGVRQYWPTKDGGRSVLKTDRIVIPQQDFRDAPVYRKRVHWPHDVTEYGAAMKPGDSNCKPHVVHAPHKWVKDAKYDYVRTRPEIFELRRDGKRAVGPMLCYGNPKTLETYKERIVDEIENGVSAGGIVSKDYKCITVSQWDGSVACTCDFCKRLRDASLGPSGDGSPIIWGWFVRELSDWLAVRYPGWTITILPYINTCAVPPGLVYTNRNVEAFICVMPGLAMLKQPEVKAREEALIRAWAKATGRKVQVWHYDCWPAEFTCAPYVYGETIAAHYRDCRDVMVGTFINGGKPRERRALSDYVWMKAMWNPGVDVHTIYDEFCGRMFGAGAKPMRELVRMQEVGWNRPWKTAKVSNKNIYEVSYPRAEVLKMQSLLAEAKRLASGDALSISRIAYYEKGFEQFFRESEEYASGSAFAPLSMQKAPKPTVDGSLDEGDWSRAEMQTFVAALDRANSVARYRTELRILWAPGEGVTFGVKCFDPDMTYLKRVAAPGILSREQLEFFFDPTGNGDGAYAQIALDINGNRSLHSHEGGWKADGIESAVRLYGDRWEAELFVPFAALGNFEGAQIPTTAAGGRFWSGNVCRMRYGQAKPNGGTGGIKSYFWTPEFEMSRLHTRYSNWNRDAAAFGRLQFVE